MAPSEIERAAMLDGFGSENCRTVISDINGVKTLDFGSNCLGNDGRLYGGTAIVRKVGGELKNPGATVEVEFINFQVNDATINGIAFVENYGRNGNNNLYGKFISDLTTTFSIDKYQFDGHQDLDIEWLKDDEIFIISGSGSGKTKGDF